MSTLAQLNHNLDAVGARHWDVRIELWHPTHLNKLMKAHYYRANAMKRSDRAIIAHYCKDIPKAQKKRFIGLIIELGYRQRGADVDAYQKSLLDGLVHAGVIKDDSKEWVEIYPVQYVRGTEAATIIRISEAG